MTATTAETEVLHATPIAREEGETLLHAYARMIGSYRLIEECSNALLAAVEAGDRESYDYVWTRLDEKLEEVMRCMD